MKRPYIAIVLAVLVLSGLVYLVACYGTNGHRSIEIITQP